MLSVDRATSPPFFDINNADDEETITGIVEEQFPMFISISGFGRICRMCLASLIYHVAGLLIVLIPTMLLLDAHNCIAVPPH